uniref:Poly(A)-specific ribonuclease RNA-binding domain-containing protein n=1 Tax=Ciona savignyi TaxID=51511 RepID=H2Y4Q6_CIOSA
MGSMLPFRDILTTTALGDMNARLREPPFQPADIAVPGKYNVGTTKSQDSNLHEAAYDAYITGAAFLAMVNYLKSFQSNNSSNSGKSLASFSSLRSLVSPYINKVFLMRSFDIPYLNLTGPDLTPSRDHVFHVEFPSVWKSSDLRQLFTPVGQIHISWINETQCWVGLHNKTQTKNVKNLIKVGSYDTFRLRTYKEYQSDASQRLPAATNGLKSPPLRPTSATPSFINIVEAAKIADPSDASVTPTQRKRPQSEVESPPTSTVDDCDEPTVKKQRSIEDCSTASPSPPSGSPDTATEPLTSSVKMAVEIKDAPTGFAVPDDW